MMYWPAYVKINVIVRSILTVCMLLQGVDIEVRSLVGDLLVSLHIWLFYIA